MKSAGDTSGPDLEMMSDDLIKDESTLPPSPSSDRLCWKTNGLILVLRLLVGIPFVIAGILKIIDPAAFALAVSHYRLVPHALINLVAILLPSIEVLAGSLVLAGAWLRPASLVITALTGTFALVIISALMRELNIECGCFGTVGGRHVGLTNLAIDGSLLCMAALLTWRTSNDVAQKFIQPK